jgi:hypothetical protein
MNFDMARGDERQDYRYGHHRRRRGGGKSLYTWGAVWRNGGGENYGQRRRRVQISSPKALGDRVIKATRSMGVADDCRPPPATPFAIGGRDKWGRHSRQTGPAGQAEAAREIAEEMVGAILGDFDRRAAMPCSLSTVWWHSRDGILSCLRECAGHPGKDGRAGGAFAGRQLCHITDMAGCAITVTKLDGDLAKYWDTAVHGGAALGHGALEATDAGRSIRYHLHGGG